MPTDVKTYMDSIKSQDPAPLTLPPIPLRSVLTACMTWYVLAFAYLGYKYLAAFSTMSEALVNALIVALGPVLVAWIVARSKAKEEKFEHEHKMVQSLKAKIADLMRDNDLLRSKRRKEERD